MGEEYKKDIELISFERWESVYIDDQRTKYRISENGILWSDYISRPMKASPNSDGYMTTCISHNKKKYTISIHRLVATTFIPNPLNFPEVNHINGDKTDNRVCNLEWVTHQQNMIHANMTGLRSNIRGEDNPNNKYPESIIHEICKMLENWDAPSYISRKLNVSINVVKDIAMQRRWNGVTSKYNLPTFIHPNITTEDGKPVSDVELLQEICLPGTICNENVKVIIDFRSNKKYKVQRPSQ